MTGPAGALRDAVTVVLDGVRLSLRHLPVLLALFLAGATVRNGVLWGAVEVSGVNSTVAGFMLPFAPLATLTALILMLRVTGATLPHTTAPGAGAGGRAGRYLALLASTLVPFLAVYAAQGYLREDIDIYVNAATYDELTSSFVSGASADIDRTAIAQGNLLVAIVVIALLLRFGLDRFGLPQRHYGFGLLAAYVEVLWLLVIAVQIANLEESAWAWVGDRVVVDWFADRWADVLAVAGPFAAPLAAVGRGALNLIDNADDIIVVPVAWLTVGAVALGVTLGAPERERPERRWRRHVERVPARVRGWGREFSADLTDRFSGLFSGIRLLVVGGLVPMLLFCLVFVLSRQAGWLVGELWRLVVGPVSFEVGIVLSPYVRLLTDATEQVLLVGLLAAAVDRIVGRTSRPTPEDVPPGDGQSIGSST